MQKYVVQFIDTEDRVVREISMLTTDARRALIVSRAMAEREMPNVIEVRCEEKSMFTKRVKTASERVSVSLQVPRYFH